ncbi:Meiosis-specific protein ASY1 [Camellia lanceoleosa]|nr:Meiosis-specific protein ASY1 [Camellia lanceoleosa]
MKVITTHDGFLDAKSNRRLGKRVIHSDLTEKKLMEVKKVLDIDAMDLDINESHNKSNHVEFQKMVKILLQQRGIVPVESVPPQTQATPHQSSISTFLYTMAMLPDPSAIFALLHLNTDIESKTTDLAVPFIHIMSLETCSSQTDQIIEEMDETSIQEYAFNDNGA